MAIFRLMSQCCLSLWCVAILATLSAVGCGFPPPITEGYPAQAAMRGKTKAEILSCAGRPIRETQEGPVTELRYYQEAPMFEESGTASKSSMPSIHHGCRVSVLLKDDRVTDVRYRFIPDFFDASNDCEEIFSDCGS